MLDLNTATALPQRNVHPQSLADWQDFRTNSVIPTLAALPGIRRQLGATLKHAVIRGVNVNILTPQVIAEENAIGFSCIFTEAGMF